ncbi:MAG: WXG100 family type VII secretion target [Phycisphaeraceae bacterium]
MAKANVDPAELRRFAKGLLQFNRDLQQMMSAMNARTNALGQSWQDQEQQRFAQEVQYTLKSLNRFLDASEEHAQFLNRKAAHVEEYLKQR